MGTSCTLLVWINFRFLTRVDIVDEETLTQCLNKLNKTYINLTSFPFRQHRVRQTRTRVECRVCRLDQKAKAVREHCGTIKQHNFASSILMFDFKLQGLRASTSILPDSRVQGLQALGQLSQPCRTKTRRRDSSRGRRLLCLPMPSLRRDMSKLCVRPSLREAIRIASTPTSSTSPPR